MAGFEFHRVPTDANRVTAPCDAVATALFVVSGDVEIDKRVEEVGIAIFTDQQLFTAYNVEEGKATKTLNFYGIYMAEKFNFQRTLQGTGNQDDPASNFVFEPKYIMQLRDFFGKNHIIWKSID